MNTLAAEGIPTPTGKRRWSRTMIRNIIKDDAYKPHAYSEMAELPERLVFTRWALVMYRFEKALYADPDRGDLNSVWWDLVEGIQFVDRPVGRDEPDWAAKIHMAVAPVYYHNYVLGHLIAAQLRDRLDTYITGGEPFFTSEVAGRYLQETLFGPGARNGWQDTVLGATGEELNPDHFVESLR